MKLQESTPKTELLNKQEGLLNTTDKQTSSQLVEHEKVEGTPFTVVRHEEKCYVMLGNYRLTEEFKTMIEAIEDGKRFDWERIMQVIGVMIEEFKK